jgi:hypothetical protein
MGKTDIDSRTDWDGLEHLRGSESSHRDTLISLVDVWCRQGDAIMCLLRPRLYNNSASTGIKTSLVCDRVRALNVLNTGASSWL